MYFRILLKVSLLCPSGGACAVMILQAMPAVALLLIAPPMPDRSKVITRTKKGYPCPSAKGWGVRLTTSPPLEGFIFRGLIMDAG
jgi:hypothetical protein